MSDITAPAPVVSPAPAQPMASPPAMGGGGVLPEIPKKKRGGLAIGMVAAIQNIYIREDQKQAQLNGMDKNVGLQPGWGGQGT